MPVTRYISGSFILFISLSLSLSLTLYSLFFFLSLFLVSLLRTYSHYFISLPILYGRRAWGCSEHPDSLPKPQIFVETKNRDPPSSYEICAQWSGFGSTCCIIFGGLTRHWSSLSRESLRDVRLWRIFMVWDVGPIRDVSSSVSIRLRMNARFRWLASHAGAQYLLDSESGACTVVSSSLTPRAIVEDSERVDWNRVRGSVDQVDRT